MLPANKPGGCAPAWAPLSRAGARAGAQVATAELRANVLAAYVAGGRSADVPAVMAAMKFGPRDSFEIAFNAACALLGAGDAPAAEQQLLLAQRLGARAALTLTHPVRFRHCTVTLHISARVPSMRTPLVAFQRVWQCAGELRAPSAQPYQTSPYRRQPHPVGCVASC